MSATGEGGKAVISLTPAIGGIELNPARNQNLSIKVLNYRTLQCYPVKYTEAQPLLEEATHMTTYTRQVS